MCSFGGGGYVCDAGSGREGGVNLGLQERERRWSGRANQNTAKLKNVDVRAVTAVLR